MSPGVGSHAFDEVTVVSLEAEADEGWVFVVWEGDVAEPDNEETTIVVDADKEVKAFFEPIPGPEYFLTLQVSGSGQGTVTLEEGTHVFAEGTVVELTATPASGSSFSYWQGDVEGVQTSLELVMEGDIHITAVFSYFSSGSGAEADPYMIKTPGELNNVRHHLSRHFKLEAVIDLSVYHLHGGWEPIGEWDYLDPSPFTGFLDGNGYIITNLSIEQLAEKGVGLFGCIGEEGQLLSVRLDNVQEVQGESYVGSLAGVNYGTIVDSSANGEIQGLSGVVGGLVGWNLGEIRESHALGDVLGQFNIGGLVGVNAGTISYSRGMGTVYDGSSAGGLVGRNEGEITSSNALGSVLSETRSVGGLVGTNWSGSQIRNSFASGSVLGFEEVGGLTGMNKGQILSSYALGDVDGTGRSVGGLVGHNRGEIDSSFATGRVSSDGQSVGGLVGINWFDSYIRNSYSRGETAGEEEVGGLVGYNRGRVINCYATGLVTGEERLGGLVGVKDDTSRIESSYYDEETTDQSDRGKGEPRTTVQMQQQGTFEDWDFQQIWCIEEESTYPFLQWE